MAPMALVAEGAHRLLQGMAGTLRCGERQKRIITKEGAKCEDLPPEPLSFWWGFMGLFAIMVFMGVQVFKFYVWWRKRMTMSEEDATKSDTDVYRRRGFGT